MSGWVPQGYVEPQRVIPLLAEADVVVAGAGPAGVVAAIAAGRQGARTIHVERYGSLGGNLTVGLNTKPTGRLLGGIPAEIWDRALAMGAAGVEFEGQTPTGAIPLCSPCGPEMMRLVLIEMCLEAYVQLQHRS